MAVARSWLTAAFLVFLLVAGMATAEDEVVQEEGYIGYGAIGKGAGCGGGKRPCRGVSNPANHYRRGCSPLNRCRGDPPGSEGEEAKN
ncbi:unnamed protein product [Spirodela intermedia]|uniref:Uncharacterized protein n=1 Tax=Spirodela intermedia TaxID=51605 RepID=A0A7I8LJ99_SPIIN|nr:unnamed protein product [Spirodela intermedia]CAA7409840.1 unnamed protein product [Spirodela intermedia]